MTEFRQVSLLDIIVLELRREPTPMPSRILPGPSRD